MRKGRQAKQSIAVVIAGCLIFGSGCGDDSEDGQSSKVPAIDQRDDTGSEGAACALLHEGDLESLFPEGVPDPSGTSMGEGFAECAWGSESDSTMVLVSTLPSDDYQSDYVDQLNVTAPVAGVGDDAVSFPGLVGIGRGSARGGSVGFAKGEHAAIVAVRSTGEPARDAALATNLAKVVAADL